MKYIVKLFVVTLFYILSTNVMAEQKIVVLDMKFVLNQSKAGKGAQDFLRKSFNNNAKKFTKLEKNLKELEGDLIAKKNVLSKEDYKKKSDNLRKKVMEYQTQRRASLDKIATLFSCSASPLQVKKFLEISILGLLSSAKKI